MLLLGLFFDYADGKSWATLGTRTNPDFMKFSTTTCLLLLSLPLAAEEKKKESVKDAKGLMGLLKKLDTDGDGKFSDGEKEAIHTKVKKEVLDRYDLDHDGKLSDEERAKAKADAKLKLDKDGKGSSELESKARAAFNKKFDKDGDGKLNEEEKKAALAAVKKLKDKSGPGDAPAPSIKPIPDDDAKTPVEPEKASR